MDVIAMATQAVREVEHLITVGARMATLVKMSGYKMFGSITLFRKRLPALAAGKLLDLQMHDTVMFTHG